MWRWKCQMWEKKKKPLNVTKILPNLMLVLLNVTIKPSNVKKKKKKTKGITKCDKRKVTSDIGIAQCEDRMIKCEKKKNKGTIECDKSTVIYDISTAQYKDETIKNK